MDEEERREVEWIVHKIEIIRDDCFDEHFTLTDIADELDALMEEIDG